ncbi:MAG: 1-deoxy-D-xylulose-5-phosphate reductoisomerase [Eubacterium sp.]|nr:1-deoxy-D-xylulose-5-phosphate reductoisomerase [Eubacterium sp.]
MKNITILGSTGSIGTQTLDVIRNYPKDFNIIALAAGTNVRLMAEQIREFHPEIAVMKDEEHAEALRNELGESILEEVRIIYGISGCIEAATAADTELVVAAMVGMIGLRPVTEAIRHNKDIALANKETLVCAGHIIMKLCREHGVRLLPVDSEHSAVFQCLHDVPGGPFENGVPVGHGDAGPVETIFLTASGGPFRHFSYDDLKNVSVDEALAHPNWSMGHKITIDSATMINKGLEIIEAMWLFDVPVEKIKVLIQPKSIIHSMVGFCDGAVLAQLGTPDMRVPIQYALMYPDRRLLDDKRLDFDTLSEITFEKPNTDVLRGIPIAIESVKTGGSMTTVMNAANEFAVEKFLQKRLPFLQIYGMIEYAMEQHTVIKDPTLDDISEVERWTYELLNARMSEVYL